MTAWLYLRRDWTKRLEMCRDAGERVQVQIFTQLPSLARASLLQSASARLCSSLVSQILQRSFPVPLLSSDLDHFKVHTRSAVSVREGQGVVLLCGTPTSSGGELSGALTARFYQRCFRLE